MRMVMSRHTIDLKNLQPTLDQIEIWMGLLFLMIDMVGLAIRGQGRNEVRGYLCYIVVIGIFEE